MALDVLLLGLEFVVHLRKFSDYLLVLVERYLGLELQLRVVIENDTGDVVGAEEVVDQVFFLQVVVDCEPLFDILVKVERVKNELSLVCFVQKVFEFLLEGHHFIKVLFLCIDYYFVIFILVPLIF